MSTTVLKLDELKAELHRKRGRTGICQNQPARRTRPDFERLPAGIDDLEPGRFAWDYAAQERVAHLVAAWGPGVVVLALAAWVGWLLLG